jgi:hypothetical protein
LYSSPNIAGAIISMKMIAGACSMQGKKINEHKTLARKHERKIPLGSSSRKWEDNKLNLKKTACEDVVWIYMWVRIWAGGGLL